MADNNKMLMYKGHPLRRKDNLIYYGSMADKYIVMIQVMSTTKDGGLEIADKVHLQLQLTDPDLKSRDRVVKKSDLPTCSPPLIWVPPGSCGRWPASDLLLFLVIETRTSCVRPGAAASQQP